jgi:AAA+ ATPase superfamily predicted ATPase
MNPFVGRKQELKDLRDLSALKQVALVTVQGRRRIGKSRLVEEFAKGKRFLSFTGISPLKAATAQAQREAFSEQLAKQLNVPEKIYKSWLSAFFNLSDYLTNEPTVILFDEISWMSTGDELLIPHLKIWFDQHLQHWPQLVLILCGSVSTWIEKNVIRSTALFGRIALRIRLKPLSLAECAELLRLQGFRGSPYEIFKILAVTGGVPWYLTRISPSETADENIKRLCFQPDGVLVTDFDFIFHDLFNGHSLVYKKIIHILAAGMKNLSEIKKVLARDVILDESLGDSLEEVVGNLVAAGFVTPHFGWSIKTEKISEDYLYRLSDNYIRFYVKYIELNKAKISAGDYATSTLIGLPGWDATMGLHVENLLLNNRHALTTSLGIERADIVADNPYIQRTNDGERGCQIDYLIQTHAKNLFICEFKFNKRLLGPEVITSVQEKIVRFAAGPEFGIFPVLFHMGEVAETVLAKQYFYKIVNITNLLELDHTKE